MRPWPRRRCLSRRGARVAARRRRGRCRSRHGAAHQRLDAGAGEHLPVDAVDDLGDEDVEADGVDETAEDVRRSDDRGADPSRHEHTTETPPSYEGFWRFKQILASPRRGNLLVQAAGRPTTSVTASRGPGRASHRGRAAPPCRASRAVRSPRPTSASQPCRTASSPAGVIRTSEPPAVRPDRPRASPGRAASRRSTRYVTLEPVHHQRVAQAAHRERLAAGEAEHQQHLEARHRRGRAGAAACRWCGSLCRTCGSVPSARQTGHHPGTARASGRPPRRPDRGFALRRSPA